MTNQAADASWERTSLTVPAGLLVAAANELAVANRASTDKLSEPPLLVPSIDVVETFRREFDKIAPALVL